MMSYTKHSPSSLAFVTSGSRGVRLLYYTKGNKTFETTADSAGKKDVLHELPPTTLAEILAPSSLMFGHKFELSVDKWKFIGHPFSFQSNSFNIAFNVVFVFQMSCSPEAVTAYDHLSHLIGSAIVHEEKRCEYLREQVSLLMQLLEDADIPDPTADVLSAESSLARSLHSILCSLQRGKQHIQVQINAWSEVNTLLAPITSPSIPQCDKVSAPSQELCVRSYSALLLFDSADNLIRALPSTCNPAMHRLLQSISPVKSLQTVSQDADIPLLQTLRMASHLVTWGRGMAIYPLSESNMYITSPSCDTRRESKLARRFSSAFPSPAPSLPEVLSHFALPISLGDLKETISEEEVIQMTVWLLQHRQVIQLHTYVYIVPTTTSTAGECRITLDTTESPDSGTQDEYSELLSHLTPEERYSVINTYAADDPEDLEQFARLSKYFRGNYHLEGIMLMENIPRSQLLTLIDKFSEILVTCTLPEHSISNVNNAVS